MYILLEYQTSQIFTTSLSIPQYYLISTSQIYPKITKEKHNFSFPSNYDADSNHTSQF